MRVPCPACTRDLRGHCHVLPIGLTTAEYLDCVRTKIELQLSCAWCGFGWTAHVLLDDFFANPIPEAL